MNTLYKKTKIGKIQYWKISVEENNIIVEYGQLGTKSPQFAYDTIEHGKNLGKKNATTAQQQALLEAMSKWNKQKKKGYVESVDDAQNDLVDCAVIKNCVEPMLAALYKNSSDKIVFPAAVQPKLDGMRCLVVVSGGGEVSLWSRTRKEINSVPHLYAAIKAYGLSNIILDGELYIHGEKFETIISAARHEKTLSKDYEKVVYNVYDIISSSPFSERNKILDEINFSAPIVKVDTQILTSPNQVDEYTKAQIKLGYEGAMIRNLAAPYEHKRSNNIQKIKYFDDDEFKIVDIKEGRGKMKEHAIFICKTAAGNIFNAKMNGDMDRLQYIWLYKEEYIGKCLTVKYQGLSKGSKVPRFPVAISIRDYE